MTETNQPEPPPLHESRLELRLDRALARATTPRGAAIVIAVASVSIMFAAGVFMRLVDKEHYPTLGAGIWWSVQTVTTVGYGDNVPTTAAGRFVAALVMVFGIGFLTVITAAITSAFVARPRADDATEDDGGPPPDQFHRIDERLAEIERSLAGAGAGAGGAAGAGTAGELATAEQVSQLDSRLERIEQALARRQ